MKELVNVSVWIEHLSKGNGLSQGSYRKVQRSGWHSLACIIQGNNQGLKIYYPGIILWIFLQALWKVSVSLLTMLSKYTVLHPLTVTIVVLWFKGDKKINQKTGSWWLVVPPVKYSHLMRCLLELMLRYLGYVSFFSLKKMFLYHLGQFWHWHICVLCSASGITNIPLEWFLKARNGVEKTQNLCFGEFLS